MPANAQILFKILVSIATFDIVPAEQLIDGIENWLGIINDEFTLTESFADFQFDSSGPIHNLQIIFVAMVVLVAIPLVSLFLKFMFFWIPKCNKSINWLNSKMFFNIYIRFGLEAYLELSLVSLLRFQNFTFGTSSEKFHSIFSTIIFVGLIAYLVCSLAFL